MAMKLQCDVCGGKLIGKPGGLFECENCGTDYSTEWARAKIQEITGSVKIEGSVAVEGIATKENLLKRCYYLLSDYEFEEAEKGFKQLLKIDPENYDAYLGLVLADLGYRDVEAFQDAYIEGEIGEWRLNNQNLQRAKQFANLSQRSWLEQLDYQKAEYEKSESEKKRLFTEQRDKLLVAYQRINQRLSINDQVICWINPDGTVYAAYNAGNEWHYISGVSSWASVIAITSGANHIVGLKSDGTVVASFFGASIQNEGQCDVADWNGIKAIAAGRSFTAGLCEEGNVRYVGNRKYQLNRDWYTKSYNICAIKSSKVCAGDALAAIKKDGGIEDINFSRFARDGDTIFWGKNNAIVDVSVGGLNDTFAVGITEDGHALPAGLLNNTEMRKAIDGWHDLVGAAAGIDHVVGLKSDGKVVVAGSNEDGKCEVSAWSDIVALFAGSKYTIGVKSDGAFVRAGETKTVDAVLSDYAFHQKSATFNQQRSAIDIASSQRQQEIAGQLSVAWQRRQAALEEYNNAKGPFAWKRQKELNSELASLDQQIRALQEQLALEMRK